MSWEVVVIPYRDGVEAELDMAKVSRIFERHEVLEVEADEFLYSDPTDPDSLWTEIYLAATAIIFVRPTVGQVWSLIFELMVECDAVLTDPSALMVLPSGQLRSELPSGATFRAVRVASSVEELLASLG